MDMDWAKKLSLNISQFWQYHRNVVSFAGLLFLFACWLNPLMEQASYKNQCISFATKEFLARPSVETKVLTERELARTEAYRFCNHI